MGLKNMTKSKNRPTKWQFFHENHQFGKVVEIKGTNGSLVPTGFSRTGTDGLKNRSGVSEGPRGGGTDGFKNRSGYGKDRRFFKNSKNRPTAVVYSNLFGFGQI